MFLIFKSTKLLFSELSYNPERRILQNVYAQQANFSKKNAKNGVFEGADLEFSRGTIKDSKSSLCDFLFTLKQFIFVCCAQRISELNI